MLAIRTYYFVDKCEVSQLSCERRTDLGSPRTRKIILGTTSAKIVTLLFCCREYVQRQTGQIISRDFLSFQRSGLGEISSQFGPLSGRASADSNFGFLCDGAIAIGRGSAGSKRGKHVWDWTSMVGSGCSRSPSFFGESAKTPRESARFRKEFKSLSKSDCGSATKERTKPIPGVSVPI